jgi:hypothetical protein
MSATEKEHQTEIACLHALGEKFEKEGDVRSILRVKASIPDLLANHAQMRVLESIRIFQPIAKQAIHV